jgi:hypothetical protein
MPHSSCCQSVCSMLTRFGVATIRNIVSVFWLLAQGMKRFKGELRQPVPEWSSRLQAFYAALVTCGTNADIQHCFDEHYCFVCGQLADSVCPSCDLYYHVGCLGRTSSKEKHIAKIVKDAYTALTQGSYGVVHCIEHTCASCAYLCGCHRRRYMHLHTLSTHCMFGTADPFELSVCHPS